jgi:hypothetical protein
MMPAMRIGAALLVAAASSGGAIRADEAALPGGLYEITSRLELPHVERWAIDKKTRLCLVPAARGPIPLPVLSDNNPFRHCAATAFVFAGGRLEYDIACPGRGAARAHAIYDIMPGRFTGRIAMVLGAKNMTMTEVQEAIRMGECETTARDSASRGR